jgi:hypothetical protein
MSDTLQLVVVVPQTQLLSDPSFPFSLSVARHYDKLKRIGHWARVPLSLSVARHYDKLKRIGHFDRCVPVFS